MTMMIMLMTSKLILRFRNTLQNQGWKKTWFLNYFLFFFVYMVFMVLCFFRFSHKKLKNGLKILENEVHCIILLK